MENKKITGGICIIAAAIGFLLFEDHIIRIGMMVLAGIGIGLIVSVEK